MRYLWIFISLFFLHEDIEVLGEYKKEDIVFVYGRYLSDGYLLSYDEVTEEVYFEYLYEDASVLYFADTLAGFILVVEANDSITCLAYTYNGNKMEEIEITEEVFSFHNHHGYLIIETSDDYYYMKQDLVIVYEPEIISSSTNDVYVQFQGNASINGEMVNEINLSHSGLYVIEIFDENYYFKYQIIIKPEIIYYQGTDTFNLVNHMIFDYPIQIFTEDYEMRLNDLDYESDYIDAPGYYFLEIYDGQVLLDVLEFKLIPKIDGILEGNVDSQSFYVFGEATLNGETVNGHCYIDDPGDYKLIIYYEGDVYATYEFMVRNQETNNHLYIYIAGVVIVFVVVIKFVKK